MGWNGRKVLVTGAGGFIGSHLTEMLVREGADVRAFVRYNSRGTYGWLDEADVQVRKAVDVVQGDIRDLDRVISAVKGRTHVFHLAAMIAIPYSYVSTGEVVAVNVNGTLNMLTACRLQGVEKMLHTSTSETYGTARYVPIDENHPLQGQSPYSASKIGADKLAESFHLSFDLPVATVRPFNTYGPRQSARAVIPTIAVQLLTGQRVKLGALAPTRDFTFVEDTARGMMRIAETPAAVGKVTNLGNMKEISIGDLLTLMCRLTGRDLPMQEDRQRIRPENSEVQRLLAHTGQAQQMLGWVPEIALEEGLKRTINWLETHLDVYRRAQSEYII